MIITRLSTFVIGSKPNNIIEKLKRYGFEPTIENARKHLSDIGGIRIICSFTTDIYRVHELLDLQDDLNIVLIKDYIKNPKPNGYQSLHLHIEIPVYLSSGVVYTRIEVQVRTIAMDFWASLEHKIYYKFRNEAPKNDRPIKIVCKYDFNLRQADVEYQK